LVKFIDYRTMEKWGNWWRFYIKKRSF